MSIGFRAFKAADIDVSASPTSGTFSVTKPTGTVSSDILIACVASSIDSTANSPTTSGPAGWTSIGSVNQVDGTTESLGIHAYWAAGSVSSLTFNYSHTNWVGWVVAGFTGVDPANPIDATATAVSNKESLSIAVGALTIATANAWQVICCADWNFQVFAATGFTAKTNTPTVQDAWILYNTTGLPTGTSGNVTLSNSGTAAGEIIAAQTFALKPLVTTHPLLSRRRRAA